MTIVLQALRLLLAGGLLVVAAGFLSACLGHRSIVAFVLSTYLLAWTMVVAFTLLLSPLDLVTAGATWAWLAAACATAGLVWHGMGRPPPPLRGSGRSVALALADPVVAVLAAVTALCVLYATALAVATPENEGDALAYHVPRAAFWHQSHAVGYVAGAVDPRLDFNPPNAEIGQLFTMLVSGTQRYVGVVQLVSLLACLVATVGIARRLRFTRSEALFAGLLLLSLPVVLTQSWTALNDLVVASTLLVASYFILGERRVDTLLAALAISLAITTKLTAPPALVLVVLLALAAPGERSRRLKRTAVALLAGVAGGCAWYVVTLRQTGKLDGGMASETGQTAAHTPGAVLRVLRRYVFDDLDLSGSARHAWLLYALVALALGAVALVLLLRHDRVGSTVAAQAGVLVAAAPLAVAAVYVALSEVIGDRLTASTPHIGSTPSTLDGATTSWFGPLGFCALVVGIGALGIATRSDRPVLAVLALAPVALIVVFAILLTWDQSRGRFMIFGFALAAVAWSAALRHRGLAWGSAGIAAVTMVLALWSSESKPVRLGPLSGSATETIWGKPDWYTQSFLRRTEEEPVVMGFAEESIPRQASLSLALRMNDYLSPYFGPELQRHVVLVKEGEPLDRRSDWLIAAPGVRPIACPADLKTVLTTPGGWLVAKRVGTSDCTPNRL